jgi:hypothetical protein
MVTIEEQRHREESETTSASRTEPCPIVGGPTAGVQIFAPAPASTKA